MNEATEIILDPSGDGNRDGRQWMAHQRDILRQLAPAEVTVVDGPREASRVARQSAMKGYRKIVTVGGDAMAHGTVNGIMELAASHRENLKIGFLSFSRPGRWNRTLGMPRALSRQLEILAAGHTLPFDVGRAVCQGVGGERLTRYFLNGACLGLSGQLRGEWRKPEAGLFDFLPHLADVLKDALTGQGPRVRIESMGSTLHQGPCPLALVLCGRNHPSLGKIAPLAEPAEGMLDLAWLEAGSPWALLRNLAGVWFPPLPGGGKGNRREGTGLLTRQSVERMRITALAGPVHLELDGQPAGLLPAQISVMPRALPVIVAPVAVKLKKPRFLPVEKMRKGRLAGNIKSAAGW